MKKRVLVAVAVLGILAFVTVGAFATDGNLVVNGGFETPQVTASQLWDIWPFRDATVDLGWTVEWNHNITSYGGWTRPDPQLEFHKGVNNWLPYEGAQHVELDTDWNDHTDTLNNEPANVKISQEIETLPGWYYSLSYAWSPRPNHNDSQLRVYVDGSEIAYHSEGNTTNQTIWTHETPAPFKAGDNTTIAFAEVGNPDSLGMFLDAVSLSCHTAVFDLIAGGGNPASSWKAGEVLVWEENGQLHVRFETDPFCMTETHLHVACHPDDIPQKNGNPIPGKFDYGNEYDACQTSEEYIISPVPPCGNGIFIAAHAAFKEEKTMWVYSDGNETFTAVSGPGTEAYSACVDGSPRSGTAVPAWQHSAWISNVNPQFTYGTWVWESYRVVNPICGDVVDFYKTFNIPGMPTGGTLWVTADNGYEAYLNNGSPLVSDGLSGDWRNSNLTESFVTTAMSAWSSVESHDLISALLEGDNTFHFATANEYFNTDDGHGSAGTVDSNPGGLIYEAMINYIAYEDSAWGAGTDFEGKNWATYITYPGGCER